MFSKKTRSYFFKRETDLIKSTKIKPIWIHASSGEFEHAKHLIKTLKDKHPLEKIVVTYSSPSYFAAIKKFKSETGLIDGYIPLPFDLKGPTYSIIKRINPKAVLFSRTDLWPELIHQLKAKDIFTMVFARMEDRSSNIFSKILNQLTYKKVDHISFVTNEDLESYVNKYGEHQSYSVDGDPRIQHVLFNSKNSTNRIHENQTTLILGSVWGEDMNVITEPIKEALQRGILNKVIIAPHEPTQSQIKSLMEKFRETKPVLYSDDENLNSQVIIVDVVGKLFKLYKQADLAFIGGSYKKKVHSVIEPLSYGIPVITGPRISNNSEAKTYSKEPKKYVYPCESRDQFKMVLFKLLEVDEKSKEKLKDSILSKLNASSKASDRITELLEQNTTLN